MLTIVLFLLLLGCNANKYFVYIPIIVSVIQVIHILSDGTEPVRNYYCMHNTNNFKCPLYEVSVLVYIISTTLRSGN